MLQLRRTGLLTFEEWCEVIVPAKWTDALQEYEKEREDALAKKALDLAKLVHVGNIPSTEATEAKLVKLFAPYAHLSESAFTIRLKGDPGSRDSWAVVQLPSSTVITQLAYFT